MTFTNLVQAQQTLCQQIGGNFVPNITIGINENSVTTTSSLLGIAGWTNQKVLINGTLVVNSNFLISGCSLKMGKNAVIRIDPNITFQSALSKYFRCGSDFWKGFVAMGGTAYFWFNQIEDASVALDIKSSLANLVVVGNNINRNNRGVFAENIVVNAIVAANKFDCNSPINGSPLVEYSFSGIELTNCSAAILGRTDNVPAYRNSFKRQSFGIKLSNTTATVGLSTFFTNKRAVEVVAGNVIIRGISGTLKSNFSANQEDIWANSANLEVFYCNLDSCFMNNINSTGNINQEKIHIYDNTITVRPNGEFATFAKYAVLLDRSKFGSDDQFRNSIDRNLITIKDFGTKKTGAIVIKGSSSTHDFMRVDSNTIIVLKGGAANSPTKFVDVSINGAENFVVTRNKIQSISNQGQSRFGFFMHDGAQVLANGNLFLYNQIFGASGNNTGYDYGCCAVHWESAGPWSVCSNTTDHTYRGFHFMGICGKSFFGKNNINDHNYAPNSEPHSGAGLIIQGLGSNNAFIGDQDCQENYWDPTDYSLGTAYTAVVLGEGNNPPGPATVQKNEFRVADLNDTHQAPIDRNPMTNWFLPGQCLQTPTDCGAQLSPPTIDENDEWVRSNYPQVQTSPGVEEWQTTRYLLAKLLRYPNLAAGNMLAFKNAYSQSSAMLFAQFDSLINSISSITAGSQTSLNSLESSIQNKQAQINVLDATISDYSNIPTEFMSSRAALMSELAILSDQKKVLLAQNTSLRVPLLTVCEQFNNSLPGNQVYEQNQKLLNTLTIQQARGIELTQYNKNALHEIAQQCIQMAGLTKSAAASMLPPEEGAQYWRENPLDYDCLQKATLNNEEVSDKFIISPNPATDLLHLQMSRPIKGEIEISDLSGRSIHVLKIKEEANVLDIPISQLENGVYLLSYSDTTGKRSASVKFVVLR